jgi:TonB family protein
MKIKRFIIVILFLAGLTTNNYGQKTLVIDAFPTNVGGKEEFKRIFEQELIYPPKLLNDKTEWKVTVNFIILKDSSTKDIKIISSGEPTIDAEALRIFKLYKWVPALKDGQYVSTNWTATFDFNPKKYSKICRDRGYQQITYLPNEKIDSSGIIYRNPDQFPMYQKGIDALQDFIKENLEYPRQAQLANIQGTVVLHFVVEPSGLVTNIGIEKSVGGGCDQEAIRVLQLIKWYPGKKNEKLARVQMSFPFYFILNSEFHDNSGSEQK